MNLSLPEASRFARLGLACIQREYPNKLDHVIGGPSQVQSPRTLHPAFYGCFDWHSAVHGHWMLVRLLKRFPSLPESVGIRAALNANLAPGNIAGELRYLKQPDHDSFERTYGWSWLLKLTEELAGWDDSDGRRWAADLEPLATAFVARFLEFLPRQTYPIRSGTHPNTAFGLGFALDYAEAVGHAVLSRLVRERSRAYFSNDTDAPAHWEPNGEDFFSPSLIEADLMRRVMPGPQFREWFHAFLPGLSKAKPATLLTPVEVSDRRDGRIVHLDGLNLSRAWCMRSIAAVLPRDDARRPILIRAATAHSEAAVPSVTSGNYAGEHWLASFAVYLLSAPDSGDFE